MPDAAAHFAFFASDLASAFSGFLDTHASTRAKIAEERFLTRAGHCSSCSKRIQGQTNPIAHAFLIALLSPSLADFPGF